MKTHLIHFAEESHEPVEVRSGRSLADALDVNNSPVLFGCRTGICGTCVVELQDEAESLAAPDEEEREILDLYAPQQPRARLACQIDVQSNLTLKTHCQNRWSG